MRASVKPETIAEIRRLREAGLSLTAVAAQLGINRSTVKKYQSDENIRRRKEISARSNTRFRVKERQGGPKGRHAITTAIPLMQQLLGVAWKRRVMITVLAKAAGVSHRTIRNWKKGVSDPTFRNLEAVADILGFELALKLKSDMTSQHAIHQTTLPDAPP